MAPSLAPRAFCSGRRARGAPGATHLRRRPRATLGRTTWSLGRCRAQSTCCWPLGSEDEHVHVLLPQPARPRPVESLPQGHCSDSGQVSAPVLTVSFPFGRHMFSAAATKLPAPPRPQQVTDRRAVLPPPPGPWPQRVSWEQAPESSTDTWVPGAGLLPGRLAPAWRRAWGQWRPRKAPVVTDPQNSEGVIPSCSGTKW